MCAGSPARHKAERRFCDWRRIGSASAVARDDAGRGYEQGGRDETQVRRRLRISQRIGKGGVVAGMRSALIEDARGGRIVVRRREDGRGVGEFYR